MLSSQTLADDVGNTTRKNMAPKKGKRISPKKKIISFEATTSTSDDDIAADSEDASPSKGKKAKEKSQAELEREQENEARKQKIKAQYQNDLKDPDALRERERKVVGDFVKKKAHGKELVMSHEDMEKIQRQLWSPKWGHLVELMGELGWHSIYESKRDYVGYLWAQETTKKGKKS